MLLTDPMKRDNPVVLANKRFCELTGYSDDEVIGRNCRFLAGPSTDGRASAALGRAVREMRPALVAILNYRCDGESFMNGVTIAPLFDGKNKLRWFVGSQLDLGPAPLVFIAETRKLAVDGIFKLTKRQREVLTRMAWGMPNKRIAWDLGISEKTVHMHRADLIHRLNAKSSVEAIRIAIEAGLICSLPKQET